MLVKSAPAAKQAITLVAIQPTSRRVAVLRERSLAAKGPITTVAK